MKIKLMHISLAAFILALVINHPMAVAGNDEFEIRYGPQGKVKFAKSSKLIAVRPSKNVKDGMESLLGE